MRFITAHRSRWGVEPICRVLQFAPSTYYAAISREASRRAIHDDAFKVEIARIHQDDFGVYGVEKVWRQLRREGFHLGRDRVARLMRDLSLVGVVRGAKKRTTVAGDLSDRPSDLVKRVFTASTPNRLWVADLTYVSTWSGFVYTSFIIDAFSRYIVGWKVATTLHADHSLDALEMAMWQRQHDDLCGLVHHSDRGVQFVSIRYTERLEEAGAFGSVGSKGDSYDNALAETVNGLYKTELIRMQGPWRTADDVELATASWVDWWNNRRIHSADDYVTPAEFEANYYDANNTATSAA